MKSTLSHEGKEITEISMHTFFELFWSDRRIGFAILVGLAVIAGLVAAWLTPRGPITTLQAHLSMMFAIMIGFAAGFVTKSLWSTLLTPTVYIIVYELARLSVDGPAVYGIHLGSTYGVIAFTLGRLFHGLLFLVPMILGVVYGVWIASYLGGTESARMGAVGWIFVILLTLAYIVLAILIARPGSTYPIIGQDGQPLPGSVAELRTVPIGGHEQVLMIRGKSIDNPVLLYLAGGPGGTDLGAMRADVTLEQELGCHLGPTRRREIVFSP